METIRDEEWPRIINEAAAREEKLKQFIELVGISIGRASVCWDEIPSGTFDSTVASELVDRIVEAALELSK